ncbi:hypothetical protein ACH5RR_001410 [Cinchona calisaya]|uniref:ATPase AAA-type core domain-containing protein n=1 Tax=Cinchona calisaya TaxID=153742 RepID=A0ABD3B3M2_9GENT
MAFQLKKCASEENIQELFLKAYRTAPSIVFIDEIDAIASKRGNLQREMERGIVTQLMKCMDESHRLVKPADGNVDSKNSNAEPVYVLVIRIINRPDAVDPALRRPGRFVREISLGVLDENARGYPGFVGAELEALANKAGNLAMKRIVDHRNNELSREILDGEHAEEWWKYAWSPAEMEKLSITMADFEVDALTTKRGREGGWVVERLLNQLLIELDGAEQRRGVYVIGATNRYKLLFSSGICLKVMDRAILRRGRSGKLLYVPMPSADERGLILKALARKKPIDDGVDLMAIGRDSSCENLSGADLSALMNETAMAALQDKLLSEYRSSDGTPWTIKDMHFKLALEKITPSVSDKQGQYCQVLSESFKAARLHEGGLVLWYT